MTYAPSGRSNFGGGAARVRGMARTMARMARTVVTKPKECMMLGAELTKERRGCVARRMSAAYILGVVRCEESGCGCIAGGASQMDLSCSVDVYIWDGTRLERIARTSVDSG